MDPDNIKLFFMLRSAEKVKHILLVNEIDDNSSPFQIQNFLPLAVSCAYTAWFVSDLFRNHIVGFLMGLLRSS